MGFATYLDKLADEGQTPQAFVVDEMVKREDAEWQVVVQTSNGPVIVYATNKVMAEMFVNEAVDLFGVWGNMYEKGQFVEEGSRG